MAGLFFLFFFSFFSSFFPTPQGHTYFVCFANVRMVVVICAGNGIGMEKDLMTKIIYSKRSESYTFAKSRFPIIK